MKIGDFCVVVFTCFADKNVGFFIQLKLLLFNSAV